MTSTRTALAAASLLAAILLSVVWWRVDILRGEEERCPDLHCGYAERLSAALAAPLSDAVSAAATFAHGFVHAQVPLPALLAAVPALLLPSTASLALVGVVTTLLAWWCVRRIVVAAWRLDPATLAMLAVAYFSSAAVLRGFALVAVAAALQLAAVVRWIGDPRPLLAARTPPAAPAAATR